MRDVYPSPRIDEWINLLGQTGAFSTVNKKSGWCNVEIESQDRDIKIILSKLALYCFVRLSFDSRNEPNTIQRAMNAALLEDKVKSALVCLDSVSGHHCGVLVRCTGAHRSSKTFIRAFPGRWIYHEAEEVQLCPKITNNPVHIICTRRLDVARSTTDAIKELRAHRIATELQTFLDGFIVYDG